MVLKNVVTVLKSRSLEMKTDLCVHRAFASLGIEYDEEHTPTIVCKGS